MHVNMDDSGESTENNTSFGFTDRCLFHLRRIGAAATCKGIGDVFLLNKPKLTIGRHIAMVDIYLNSSVHKQLISRQHAILTIEHHNDRQMVYIQDKSTNGTFLNDIKIAGRVAIKEGDTLTFGHTSGVKLKPGMLCRQIYSEFRFVLEKVLSENAPPGFISHHATITTTTTTNPLSRDQDIPHLGHDTSVLSDIAVVQESNSENKTPRLTTPSRVSSFQPNSKSGSSDTLTPTSFGTPQRFTSPTHLDDQTPATKSKQSTVFNLQSTTGVPVASEMPCNADKNLSSTAPPETLASKHFTETLETSAISKGIAPGDCISNKEVRNTQSKDTHGSGICEEDKHTASNLDEELFQLTSAVSAKAEHFDSLASEQELDTLSPRFQFGNQTFPSPKIAKNTSQTRWSSSTPCKGAHSSASSDNHPSRPSSPVLSCTISSQTPMSTPSASDQEKVASCLGDSISTVPSKTSPFQSTKTVKTPEDPEQSQIKKRGGQSSSERPKKKCTKRHHRRTAKSKTPATAKQPLGPPIEVQMPDVEFEVCDSYDCCRPTDITLAWVQCDSCDSWYHVTCVGCDYDSVKKDSASFHCGCSK